MEGGDGLAVSRNRRAELAHLFERKSDPRIRTRLIHEHINLVKSLASKFANRGEPLEDLVQVGTIGLINAIDRFDPLRGIKFSTYATPTIAGEIKRYFRDKGWRIKVPRRLKDLNLAAGKAQDELKQKLERDPTLLEIAEAIGASEQDTIEAMQIAGAYETVSLDNPGLSDNESAQLSPSDFLGEVDSNIAAIIENDELIKAMETLESRLRIVIYLRFFEDMAIKEVANRLDISPLQVSRLQQKALLRLNHLMSNEKLIRAAIKKSNTIPLRRRIVSKSKQDSSNLPSVGEQGLRVLSTIWPTLAHQEVRSIDYNAVCVMSGLKKRQVYDYVRVLSQKGILIKEKGGHRRGIAEIFVHYQPGTFEVEIRSGLKIKNEQVVNLDQIFAVPSQTLSALVKPTLPSRSNTAALQIVGVEASTVDDLSKEISQIESELAALYIDKGVLKRTIREKETELESLKNAQRIILSRKTSG